MTSLLIKAFFLNCLLKKKIQFKEEKQKALGGEEIKGKKISQWRRKLWSCHYIHSELPIWEPRRQTHPGIFVSQCD